MSSPLVQAIENFERAVRHVEYWENHGWRNDGNLEEAQKTLKEARANLIREARKAK